MSFDGGWRHIKIVEPTSSRYQEIVGGLKNALERGETLEKAKMSFISSGYTPEEVQQAIQMMDPQSVKPLVQAEPSQAQDVPAMPEQTPQQTQSVAQQPQAVAQQPENKPRKSKKKIIIVSIVGVVVLGLALLAGIFWDQLV